MAICEICGTGYTPTPKALDCPRCAANLARMVGAKEAPAKAGRAPAGPEGRVPQRTAAGKPAANPAARPVARAVAKPAAKPAAASKPAAAKRQRTPHEPLTGPRTALDQTTKIGLLSALGLALIVGVVVTVVGRNKAAEKRVQDAYEKGVQDLYQQLQGLSVEDPAAAEKIIQLASEKEADWVNHALGGQIQSLVARAKTGLASAQEKRQTLARFTDLEKELESSGVTAERLKDLRRQLDESEASLADGGADLVARVAVARRKADESYAHRLLEEAKGAAAQGGGIRSNLARYQAVEDELKTLLDRAYFQKNKENQDLYTPLYKQAIEASDKLATDLFAAEGEKAPWTDCLVAPQSGNWNASTAKGFSYKVEGGVLRLIGPDADEAKLAVISIGDREQWRHFQIDLEFEVEKGDVDIYFRLGRSPSPNTLSYPLRTVGNEANLIPGRNYSARISVIGSRFSVRFAGEDIDTPSPYDENIGWTMNRKGAIGLVLTPETRVNVTSFKVRDLR